MRHIRGRILSPHRANFTKAGDHHHAPGVRCSIGPCDDWVHVNTRTLWGSYLFEKTFFCKDRWVGAVYIQTRSTRSLALMDFSRAGIYRRDICSIIYIVYSNVWRRHGSAGTALKRGSATHLLGNLDKYRSRGGSVIEEKKQKKGTKIQRSALVRFTSWYSFVIKHTCHCVSQYMTFYLHIHTWI